MRNPEDLYEILQVHPSAHPDVIESAYRRLLRVHHPDVNPSTEAHRMTVQLNHAYSVLSNPERRAAYDRERQEEAHRLQPASDSDNEGESHLNGLLLQAADQGNTDRVRTLIARGADVNARDEWDLTALHRAAHRRYVETANALLAQGANFRARDRWQRTPLDVVPESYPEARFALAEAIARTERDRRAQARRGHYQSARGAPRRERSRGGRQGETDPRQESRRRTGEQHRSGNEREDIFGSKE